MPEYGLMVTFDELGWLRTTLSPVEFLTDEEEALRVKVEGLYQFARVEEDSLKGEQAK